MCSQLDEGFNLLYNHISVDINV